MKRTAIAAALAALIAGSAYAGDTEIVIYKQPDFRGQSYLINGEVANIEHGLASEGSSMVVKGGFWEVCTEHHFQGNCYVIASGQYPRLMGLDNRIVSARFLGTDQRHAARALRYTDQRFARREAREEWREARRDDRELRREELRREELRREDRWGGSRNDWRRDEQERREWRERYSSSW